MSCIPPSQEKKTLMCAQEKEPPFDKMLSYPFFPLRLEDLFSCSCLGLSKS